MTQETDNSEPKCKIDKDWNITDSDWTPEENKIGIEFIKHYCMDFDEKLEAGPQYYATTTKDIRYPDYRKGDWWKTRKSKDLIYSLLPEGSRVKIVMWSRFGDIGITNNLDAINGYIYRLFPFEKTLTNISYNKEI